MRTRWSVLLSLGAAGCAFNYPTVTYPGPRRPANEVAVLVNSETALDLFDDHEFHHVMSQEGVRYEILPGRHKLGVSVFVVAQEPGSYANVERSNSIAYFCIDAQAGHTYVIWREGRGESWRPMITDEATRTVVPFAPCPNG